MKGSESRAVIEEYALPDGASGPYGIATGPDRALWFTEMHGGRIGRITTEGEVSAHPLPTADAGPATIAAGPDGALWFTEHRGNNFVEGFDTYTEKAGYLVPADVAFSDVDPEDYDASVGLSFSRPGHCGGIRGRGRQG